MLDAYTTTNRYPYSQGAITTDLPIDSGLDHALQLRPELGEGGGRRLRRLGHVLRDRPDEPIIDAYRDGLPRAVHRRRRDARGAAGALPVPRGPLPGADEPLGAVPPRRPRATSTTSPTGWQVTAGPRAPTGASGDDHDHRRRRAPPASRASGTDRALLPAAPAPRRGGRRVRARCAPTRRSPRTTSARS